MLMSFKAGSKESIYPNDRILILISMLDLCCRAEMSQRLGNLLGHVQDAPRTTILLSTLLQEYRTCLVAHIVYKVP